MRLSVLLHGGSYCSERLQPRWPGVHKNNLSSSSSGAYLIASCRRETCTIICESLLSLSLSLSLSLVLCLSLIMARITCIWSAICFVSIQRASARSSQDVASRSLRKFLFWETFIFISIISIKNVKLCFWENFLIIIIVRVNRRSIRAAK